MLKKHMAFNLNVVTFKNVYLFLNILKHIC